MAMHMLDALRSVVSIALVFTVLVAFHELGHYLLACKAGMAVEEFAIGFGPKLGVWRRRKFTEIDPDTGEEAEYETEFTFRAIPLGGFVRMRGQLPTEDGSEFDTPGGFYNKSPWARMWVLLAGPVFSMILGVAFLATVWATVGRAGRDPSPFIGTVTRSGAAWQAGLRPGDRLVSVGGKPIEKFYDAILEIRGSNGRPVEFVVERDGRRLTKSVTPIKDELETPVLDDKLEPTAKLARQFKIGVAPRIRRLPTPLGDAVGDALVLPFNSFIGLVDRLAHPAQLKDTVSGPVGIAQDTAEASKDAFDLIELAGLLSISLGIFNLIPIPPLDGGQMAITLVEILRRRRTSLQARIAVTLAGIMAMVALTVSVLVLDVKRMQSRPAIEQERR